MEGALSIVSGRKGWYLGGKGGGEGKRFKAVRTIEIDKFPGLATGERVLTHNGTRQLPLPTTRIRQAEDRCK